MKKRYRRFHHPPILGRELLDRAATDLPKTVFEIRVEDYLGKWQVLFEKSSCVTSPLTFPKEDDGGRRIAAQDETVNGRGGAQGVLAVREYFQRRTFGPFKPSSHRRQVRMQRVTILRGRSRRFGAPLPLPTKLP